MKEIVNKLGRSCIVVWSRAWLGRWGGGGQEGRIKIVGVCCIGNPCPYRGAYCMGHPCPYLAPVHTH